MLSKNDYAKSIDQVPPVIRDYQHKMYHQMVYLGLPPVRSSKETKITTGTTGLKKKKTAADPVVGGQISSADQEIKKYEEMKEQNPRSVEVLCKLAEAYLKKYYETSKSDEKYLEESYKEALNARSIDPTSVLPRITIAKIFEAQGQSQVALTHAKKAVELEPGNPEAKQLVEQLETSPPPVMSPPAAKTQPTVKAKSTTSGGGVTVMPGGSIPNGVTILIVFLCASSLVLVILILAVRRRKNVVQEKICAGLDVLYSDGGRKSFSIQTSKTTIGRDPTNSLVVNDQDVSSFHAEIVVSKDGFLLKDLGSANGTYVNGKKISECYLYVGDEIILGTTKISLTN